MAKVAASWHAGAHGNVFGEVLNAPLGFAELLQIQCILAQQVRAGQFAFPQGAPLPLQCAELKQGHCPTGVEPSPAEAHRQVASLQRCRKRVRFADEDSCGQELAEVFEVEPLKEAALPVNRVQEEKRWHDELCQLLESEEPQVRLSALPRMAGVVVDLALTESGSEVVCRALEVARPGEEQNSLAEEMHGRVCDMIASPHGSEVLQCVVELTSPKVAKFIAEELKGVVAAVACHSYGHEVLCRLLEYLAPAQLELLFEELLPRTVALCGDQHGSIVVGHILEYGTTLQQRHVCQVVSGHLSSFITHTYAQRVIEKTQLLAPGLQVSLACGKLGVIAPLN